MMTATVIAAAAQEGPAKGIALPKPEKCAVPKGLLPQDAALRHSRSAWIKGGPLVIVAVGSGSTAGAGAGGETAAYPYYLRAALAAQFPGRDIRIVNHGHSGDTASTMVERFRADVLAEKPNLVVWQTGTVEAVRSLDVDAFATTLSDGIDLLRAANADVILVNPQYAARMELLINYDPYLSVMDVIAGQTDATLFDRFHIMRHWVGKGLLDLSSGSKEQRRAKAEEAQACIGMVLADVVAHSLK